MALKGELLSADLSNVFQMLAMNGKRGLLTVQDRINPVVRRRFYLDAQTVLLAESVSRRPSLALLVEMGRVTFDQYSSAMQRARRFNSDPFGILKAQGILTDEDVEAYRTRAATESLLEVFLWRDIRFDLDESATQPEEADSPPLHLDHVIMEAARRQDEWKHVVETVGSHREVFRRCADAGDLSVLSPVERIVYEYVDSIDSTPDIMAKSELPRYFVDLGLAALVRAGLISRLGPEELMIAGNRLVEQTRIREGIRLFHCALRNDRTSLAIHKRIAEAHEQAGECARASSHLRFCAMLELSAGRHRESLALLQRAWTLLPTHFSTLERILSVIREDPTILTKEDRACVADARKLLQVWTDTGEHERALDLASRLWAIDQTDTEVLHTAARLSVRLGRIESAVAAYVALAEGHRANHNLKGAIDIYRTIASLDAKSGKAYEGVIDELRNGMDKAARRKAQGKGLRNGLMALAAFSVLYAGYAWFGEQVLRDLEDRLAADASQRDELLPKVKSTALWFRITPAGAKADHMAANLDAEIDAERDAQRLVNEQAAERTAARQREADTAVAEGLRMVKAGDLAGAAQRLKEGLASFPTQDCAAASRAAKALSDVELYLNQGRRLLDEATELEASDPDAAFRLRLKAMREFELLPECKGLKLTLRVEAVPAEARLTVRGDPEEYTAPIGIQVDGQGLLTIEGAAPGFIDRTMSINLPPEVAAFSLVLERVPKSTLKTTDALTTSVALSDGRLLATARTGPVLIVDPKTNSVATRYEPPGIESLSRPPVVSGNRILCVLDDGRVRVLALPGLKAIRASRLKVLPGVAPVATSSGGWAVATPDMSIELLDKDGVAGKRFQLPSGVVIRELAVAGDTVYCAAGEVGVLSLDTGAAGTIRTVSPKYTEALLADGAGALIAHRPQAGVVRIDLKTGKETVLLQHPGDVCRLQKVGDAAWAALFDGELAFFAKKGSLARAKLRGARSDAILVVDPIAGTAGTVVDGWCSIFSPVDGRCVAGYLCEPAMTPTFLGHQFVKVHADGRITFTDT